MCGLYKYWFATSYILLYIFSPYLNILINVIDKKKHLMLIFLLVVIWSVIPTFTTAMLNFSSIGWFATLYIIAAYIRLYPNNWFEKSKINIFMCLSTYMLILLSIIVFDIIGVKHSIFSSQATYFTGENKLPLLFCAITLFLGFKNIEIRSYKIVNIIASSMFGVYLIHDNDLVRHFLWMDVFKNSSYYQSPCLVLHAISVILVVFFVCLFIDQARYFFIAKPLFRSIQNLLRKNIENFNFFKTNLNL